MLGVFIGNQTTLDDAGTDLVNHVLLAHGFPELSDTHAHIAHRGNETVTVELSIHLELRHLGDQGIDIRIIEFQTLGVASWIRTCSWIRESSTSVRIWSSLSMEGSGVSILDSRR